MEIMFTCFHLYLHRTLPSTFPQSPPYISPTPLLNRLIPINILLPPIKYKIKTKFPKSDLFQRERGKTQVMVREREMKEMKEGTEVEKTTGKRVGSGSAGGGGVRSETEKEKTKMRERQRRAITTNIFHGLRKHGGYRLTPRADINEVLRELAKEAGWVVEPDGTTYRSASSILNRCSVCGTVRSTTPTPTSSAVVGGGGGECSTPASPCRLPVSVRDYAMIINDNVIQAATPFFVSGGGASCSSSQNPTGNANINSDIPLALYVYGGQDVRRRLSASAAIGVCGGSGSKDAARYEHLQEARASNQSTPEGSPLPRS